MIGRNRLLTSPRHSALRGLDEGDEVFDVGIVGGGICLEGREGNREIDVLFEKEFFVGGLEGADVVFGEAATLEADLVETTGFGVVAFGDGVGGDVLRDTGHAADDGVAADTRELVDGGESGNDGVVLDGDVSGDGGVVRKNDMAADLAFVGNVGVTEEKVVTANAGRSVIESAAMDRAVLAELVPVTDLKGSGLAGVFEILGSSADGGEGKEFVFTAKF